MTFDKLTKEDYKKLAKEAGLSSTEANHYAMFMLKRFPQEFDKHYAYEWATRFARKSDWAYADEKSRKALIEVGHRFSNGGLRT